MENGEEVFVVTAGEYSDYHVCGIFKSEAEAREFMTHPGDGYSGFNEIETYCIGGVLPEYRAGKQPFYVLMDFETGNVERVEVEVSPHDSRTAKFVCSIWNRPTLFRYEMWARDAEEAVKIAAELRQARMREKAVSGQ